MSSVQNPDESEPSFDPASASVLAMPLKTRKALLVGISYAGKCTMEDGRLWSFAKLNSAHDDVKKWKKTLMEIYDYKVEDIVCLVDSPANAGTNRWPNKANIIRELEDLVDHLRSGDRRFLFVSAQCAPDGVAPNSMRSESSGTNEEGDDYIWTSDGPERLGLQILTDKEIHRSLLGAGQVVKGATLTAVIESSRSSTLLDLPFEMEVDGDKIEIEALKKDPMPLQGNIICISGCNDGPPVRESLDPCRRNEHPGLFTECFKIFLEYESALETLGIGHLVSTLTGWLTYFQGDQPLMLVVTCGCSDTAAVFKP